AIKYGNMAAIKLLIRSRVNVNSPGNDGSSPVQCAAKSGDVQIMELLMRHGADVNALPSRNEGYTALHFAAEKGKIDMVRVLLDAGAHAN
ncbi:ankyrin repeat protein, partial [Glonium stellatum]